MRVAVVIAGMAIATVMATLSLFAHDPITTKVSWDREIAPIVQARCVGCHAPDGPAPMSLVTYAEARPWARAIREEVLARRMPKWPVVRGYGDFANDPSLSPFEIALLTAWVDGGAPKSIIRLGQRVPLAASPPVAAAPALPSRSRPVSLACDATDLPRGRLLGLEPTLARGGSMEVVVRHADGLEPALWLRDFDPDFANTYWFRRPLELGTGSGISIAATPAGVSCRLVLLYAN